MSDLELLVDGDGLERFVGKGEIFVVVVHLTNFEISRSDEPKIFLFGVAHLDKSI